MRRQPTTTTLVVSGVRSRTHLVYVASYLRHLLSTRGGPVDVLVLDTGTFLGRSRVAASDVSALLPASPEVRLLLDPPDGWERRLPSGGDVVLCSVGAPGLRAWGRLVVARRRRPVVVVVDEGIGSYGTWRTRCAAYRRVGQPRGRSLVRAVAVAAGARVLTDVRWRLYERDGSRWQVVEEVADDIYRRPSGRGLPSGTAVYLSQPWPDLGVVTEAGFRRHVERVVMACRSAGLDAAIRPHPAEPTSRYASLTPEGVTVLRGTRPAELDPAVLSASVVLGSSSTALLNVAALHGIPALRVRVPGVEPIDAALAPDQRGLLDTFLPAPIDVERLPEALRALPETLTAS